MIPYVVLSFGIARTISSFFLLGFSIDANCISLNLTKTISNAAGQAATEGGGILRIIGNFFRYRNLGEIELFDNTTVSSSIQ